MIDCRRRVHRVPAERASERRRPGVMGASLRCLERNQGETLMCGHTENAEENRVVAAMSALSIIVTDLSSSLFDRSSNARASSIRETPVATTRT